MRVPSAVRAVFDKFPVVWLPEYNELSLSKELNAPLLAVYSLDEDNLPLEPKCLAAAALLRVRGVDAGVESSSPYISSLETLPLLISDADKSVQSTLDQVLSKYFADEAQDPEFVIYRSLVETWVDDAWHVTIMDPVHSAVKERVFNSSSQQGQIPWPFSWVQHTQLDTHLEERYVKARAAICDDYVCSQENLLRTGMALNALDDVVSAQVEEPTILDILVFSYIWPIARLLPDSALAALITPKLHAHAQSVRQYLTR